MFHQDRLYFDVPHKYYNTLEAGETNSTESAPDDEEEEGGENEMNEKRQQSEIGK